MIATLAEHHGNVDASGLHGDFPVGAPARARRGRDRADGLRPRRLADGRRRAPVRDRVRRRATCGSRRVGSRTSSHPACTARCTNAVTGSTRRGSPTRCSALRSVTQSRSGSTSPRAGCGRTWSVADAPSAGVLAPRITGRFGTRFEPDSLYRAVNKIEPVVHPRRGRRGDLRAAHRAALRARAGADRRPARGRRSAGGMERPLQGVSSDSRSPMTPHGVLQDVHWSAG